MRSSSEQSRLILVEARRCVHQRARPCIITRVEYSTRKPATGGLVALDDLPAESGRPKCHKRIRLRPGEDLSIGDKLEVWTRQ